MKWTATILFALAATLARADYPAGTTDSDLLRSGTPVVTNAWLAVSNDTARLVSLVAGDASRITDGTNMIDAARNVWQSYSGRVCTNASEAWTYVVGGVTYTAEQMAEAVGGGYSDYSQILVWMNSTFMGRDEEEEYEGWFILNGSGTAPLGYSYATGEIPESSADPFLALSEYEGFNYAVGKSVPIMAYRGTFASGTNYVGRLALTNDIPDVTPPDFTTNNAQLVATIEATAPAPGNYLAVSNRAMTAIQEHQTLWPAVEASTNYTDAALGAFASTGAVKRAELHGTPTRWTDATGCVWEVMLNVWVDHQEGNVFKNGVSIFPSDTEDGEMRGYLYYGSSAMEYVGETGGGWYYNGVNTSGSPSGVLIGGPDATSLDGGRFTFGGVTNLVGRVALTNDIPDVSGYTTHQQATNAAISVADAKISTNNAAFVSAVTNCPVVIASGGGGGGGFPAGDWSDYGTLGALLAAIIAAITWLKNNQRYALHTVTLTNGAGTLLDRAGNRVEVSGDTTLTLPAAVPGYLRDFLVRLEISGSTVPTITFAAPTGETIVYETDGDDFPAPDEAGKWSYSFTENCVAHTFAVSLKKVNTVAAPQAQGGS